MNIKKRKKVEINRYKPHGQKEPYFCYEIVDLNNYIVKRLVSEKEPNTYIEMQLSPPGKNKTVEVVSETGKKVNLDKFLYKKAREIARHIASQQKTRVKYLSRKDLSDMCKN